MRGVPVHRTGPTPLIVTVRGGTKPCLNAELCVVSEREDLGGKVSREASVVNGQRIGLARPGFRFCPSCIRRWDSVSNGW